MSLLTPSQRLFEILKQAISSDSLSYMSREDAYNAFRENAGQDFGYDYDKWAEWLLRNTNDFAHGSYGKRYRISKDERLIADKAIAEHFQSGRLALVVPAVALSFILQEASNLEKSNAKRTIVFDSVSEVFRDLKC